MACSTFSSRWKRICWGIALAKFVAEFGRCLTLHSLYKRFRFLNIVLYFVTVIIIVGQRRVHFGEGQLRIVSNNFLNGIAQALMPNDNVLHSDTVSRNTGFPATRARSRYNVFCAENTVENFVR